MVCWFLTLEQETGDFHSDNSIFVMFIMLMMMSEVGGSFSTFMMLSDIIEGGCVFLQVNFTEFTDDTNTHNDLVSLLIGMKNKFLALSLSLSIYIF